MADHDASVEVTTATGSYKISGSETFVEKMLDLLPALLPAAAEDQDESDDDQSDDARPSGGVASLDDFITKAGITNEMSGEKKIAAFVYFLTKIDAKQSCSIEDIESCFDKAGLKTPERLATTIANAKNRSGYIRTVTHAHYATTTKGNNVVKEMLKAS